MPVREAVTRWLPFLAHFENEVLVDTLITIMIASVGWIAWNIYKRGVVPALLKFSERTENTTDDLILAVVQSFHRWFFIAVTAYLACLPWGLPARTLTLIHKAFVIVVFLQIAIVLRAGFLAFFEMKIRKQAENRPGLRTSLDLMRSIVVIVIYIVVFLVGLSNLGFDISALVAGLGIGGIAVALGVQKVLADFFSSLFIILDRPFEAGDNITTNDVNGTVERVGMRTTRIRSISGEEVIVSNAELASARVRNFKRMQERRVLLKFGVDYGAKRAQLEKLTAEIRKIIDEEPHARFDRSHFATFGSFALEVETVYWVMSADFPIFMDVQQAVNFRIMEAVEAAGLSFAYPTQVVRTLPS